MLKYDHYIFDFDGTISDSYPYFLRATRKVVDHYGISITDEQIYEIIKWKSVAYFFDHLGLQEHIDEVMHMFNTVKREMLITQATPIEGAAELLEKICNAGGKCYVYSHSGTIVIDNSQRWGIDCYFTDYFLGSKYPRKPAPDALFALLQKHGLDASRCVMIGDRDIDVIAGKNAGMDGILIDGENYYRDLDVTHRVRDIKEIEQVIFE